MSDAGQAPMRFIGWSVIRVDASSSFGIYERREDAEEFAVRLRHHGNPVHVVRVEAPEEHEVGRQELARLRDQQTALLALHRPHELNDGFDYCRHCSLLWPCDTAQALGVTS